MDSIEISTDNREEFIDITHLISDYIGKKGLSDTVLFIYSPHTTCGITVNEHADPDVKYDIVRKLRDVIPFKSDYRHIEGNSDAHIKTSLVGNSTMVIVENGKLILGRWQGIFLAEFDGPRKRVIWIKTIKN